MSLVVDRAGAVYAASPRSTRTARDDRLIAFAPDGSIRAEYQLGGGVWHQFGLAHTGIDLAADQCTLFLIEAATIIQRFNVCTGTFLPDFASATNAFALRVLPDSGVLVSTHSALLRYAPNGTLVRTYPLEGYIPALMLTDGGARLRYAEQGCGGAPRVATLDLVTGTIVSTVGLDIELPDTIATPLAWTAAIGNVHANEIPATGTVALIAMAMVIGVAATFRLR